MPTQLLDLSDELLEHIASFVHGDSEIPLPSFTPHWDNRDSSIDPAVQEDYLSLRFVCKRFHTICKLKNLHLKIEKWSDILRWLMEGPREVIKGVRRIIIDIEREVGPRENEYSNDSANETQHGEWQDQRRYAIIGEWVILLNFLKMFISLEELIIQNTPFCRHGSELQTNTLPDACGSLFPNLKSFSIETNCEMCTYHLPRLIAPSAPHIQYLKLDEFCSLGYIVDLWQKIHPTQSWNLQKLIVRLCSFRITAVFLKRIVPYVAELKELHLAKCDSVDGFLKPGFSLGVKVHPTLKATCSYKVFEEYRLKVDWKKEEYSTDWSQDTTWEEFLTELAKLPKLEILDCVMMPLIHPHMLEQAPKVNVKSARSSRAKRQEQVQSDVERHKIMKGIIEEMVSHVPNLCTVYLWNYIREPKNELEWTRWAYHHDEKTSQIEVDSVVEEFSREYTINENGLRTINQD